MATLQQLAGFSARVAVDLSSREVQERLSQSAVSAFFKLAQAWQFRDESARRLLGGVSNGFFYQLKRGQKKTLDQDKLTRISLLVGIFRALNALYSPRLADTWVNLPNANPMFEGEAPLAYMIRDGVPALMRVRQMLDARRGGKGPPKSRRSAKTIPTVWSPRAIGRRVCWLVWQKTSANSRI